MGSSWTHALCSDCWYLESYNPPFQMTDPPTERCCRCGRPTTDGIYHRKDPRQLACHGEHAEHSVAD